MNGSIFLISRRSIQSSGVKSRTSPAMRVGKSLHSKRVIGPMPERPAMRAVQFFSTPVPRGVTRPTPVTTTRRAPLCARSSTSRGMLGRGFRRVKLREVLMTSMMIARCRLTLTQGDLTQQDVDAIVNAANSTLLGGGGVDGAIHRRGGPDILAACRRIRSQRYPDGLPPGQAVLTVGGNLPARHVIHTVGPVYSNRPDVPALL